MASASFAIFAGPPWRIGVAQPSGDAQVHPLEVSPSASPEELADVLFLQLRSLGHRAGQEVVLALPGDWCLSAAIDVADLPKKDRRQAMLYRLEEKLPLAAEEFTADFVEGKTRALGVAARTDRLAPMVAALERHDIRIAVICPTALLAGADRLEAGTDASLLRLEADRVDLLAWQEGDLSAWYSLPGEARDISLQLKVLSLALGREAVVAKSAADSRHALQEAARRGAVILGASVDAPVNLRRDALAPADAIRSYRTPLYAACAGVALLLVSLIGVLLWRAHQYDGLAAASEARQHELFRATFPDQTPPAAIRSRLASEETRLRAVGGVSSALPAEIPTLLVLRDALAALPTRVRYRLLEIRVDGQTFQIDGQTLSHTDADTLASALRASGAFAVEPPRTEQLASGNGVSFTLSGTIVLPPSRPARQQPSAQASLPNP